MTRAERRIADHIRNLEHPDDNVAIRAEHNLIRYYGVRALDKLLQACSDPSPRVRLRAVWALGLTRDPRAFDTILNLTKDPDDCVRYDAIMVIGIHGDARALPRLMELLFTGDYGVSTDGSPAAMALERMGPAAVPSLKLGIEHPSPDVRNMSYSVLGNLAEKTGDPGCRQLLERGLHDPDSAVREGTRYWIEEIENRILCAGERAT